MRATAVIGAGPAGLLFVIIARILYLRAEGAAPWTLRLFDKRESYARTHRLRLDAAPFVEIQRALSDVRFDRIVSLLHEHELSPEVNLLETALVELAAELGVTRELLAIGEDGIDLPGLRRKLELDGTIGADDALTIVAADSVHSTVREMVRGPIAATTHTHERVARLRIEGEGLPKRLGAIDRVRLSKVLGSIVDYRLNRNGFAEVDLFLSQREHEAVHALGATPRTPVAISRASLGPLRAPLFRSIVRHLEARLPGHRTILLHSTFVLEHTLMPEVVFERPELRAHVFLLGDAAVSLPFFRGMACLARSALALAHVHVDLALANEDDTAARMLLESRPLVLVGARPLPGRIIEAHRTVYRGRPASVVLHRWLGRYGVHVVERAESGALHSLRSVAPVSRSIALRELDGHLDLTHRYTHEVNAIRAREVGIVAMRARLVRAARELARISAMLPFPLQSTLLHAPELAHASDRMSPLALINAALALMAGSIAIGGSIAASALSLLALPLELAGGVAFHAALALDPGPHRWVRRVWQTQIALTFLVGVPLAVRAGLADHLVDAAALASWWLTLAAAFVAGLYGFERFASGVLERAALDE